MCLYVFSPRHVEEECVLGVVGRPVSLPCFYPDLLTSVNYSIVWRTDEEVVLRARFQRNKSVEELGANSASISEDAPLTGNFSLTLPAVESKAPKVTYRLFTLENQSAALCTVCLRVAGEGLAVGARAFTPCTDTFLKEKKTL